MSMVNMQILVTGGTGFVGGSLVKALVDSDYRVRCLVRPNSKVDFLRSLNVELVYGDITDKTSVDRAVNGVEAVFHAAGVLGKWGAPREIYERTHVDGTRVVLEACIDHVVRRFLYCSTSGVLGPISGPLVDENAPYNPTNDYEYAKTEAEKLVLSHRADLDVTVIRPGLVYGPMDMHTLPLFQSIQKGRFFFMGDGKSLLHPVYIDDLSRSFILCLENPKSVGQVYLIGGEPFVTVEEFVEVFLKELGCKRKIRHVPLSLTNFLAGCAEFLGKAFGFEPPLTYSRVKFFTESRAFSIGKAVSDLSYEPVKFEVGISRTVKWYRDNGYL